MSEEKKCCGCCGNKELSNEQLEKVAGGGGWQNGKYICDYVDELELPCPSYKTVDGVKGVCTCVKKTNGVCCKEFKDKCTCSYWDKKNHKCNC